jgi:hypothetical protein
MDADIAVFKAREGDGWVEWCVSVNRMPVGMFLGLEAGSNAKKFAKLLRTEMGEQLTQ